MGQVKGHGNLSVAIEVNGKKVIRNNLKVFVPLFFENLGNPDSGIRSILSTWQVTLFLPVGQQKNLNEIQISHKLDNLSKLERRKQ